MRAKGAPRDSGRNESDGFVILAVLMVAVVMAPPFIWKYLHTEIATFYGYVRYAQLWIFQAFADFFHLHDAPGFAQIGAWVRTFCAPADTFSLCQRDFTEVSWASIADSTQVINIALFVVLAAVCLRYLTHVYRTHPSIRFNKIHTLASFIRENQPLYPHLRVFSKLNLIDKPLDDPIWGMSLTSRQFAQKHQLVEGWSEEEPIKDQNGVFVQTYRPSINRTKAAKVFALQLGERWVSDGNALERLSVAETLLMAIAIPRVAATDTGMSDKAFDVAMRTSREVIAWCWGLFEPKGPDDTGWMHPEVDLAYPRAVIGKYITHPAVKPILARHAYCRTVIIALFVQARRLGVLAPCEMRWLRFFDRELWYVLQNIGRQAAFAEGSTAFALYLLELRTGEAAATPYYDHAIDGLDAAISAFRFTEKDTKSFNATLPSQSVPPSEES